MRLVTRLLAPKYVAHAHCDLPCGVYDPAQARIEADSVKACMEKHNASDDPAFKERAIFIKEERADLVKHHLWVLWTDYFKPEHQEKYPELSELFWKTTKAAGEAKKTTDTAAEVKAWPTAVPKKVGPPPIAPSASRNPQLGIARVPSGLVSAVSGATMPKPSVALCNAKPMTSSVASAISPCAADWPMARPSAKLCRPMPTAINKASRRAGDQEARPMRDGARSSTATLPAPDDPFPRPGPSPGVDVPLTSVASGVCVMRSIQRS